jgi:hypothetical protein
MAKNAILLIVSSLSNEKETHSEEMSNFCITSMYQPKDHDGTRTLKKTVDFSSCVQVTNKEREMLQNFKNINIKMLTFCSKYSQKHELHHGEK